MAQRIAIDWWLLVAYCSGVGKTKRSVEVAYLDPEKLALLKRLSEKTRIPRAVLMREAVDDLLAKHGLLKRARTKP